LYSRCVASRYRVSITQKIVVANFIWNTCIQP
jgi:hypothetical protein